MDIQEFIDEIKIKSSAFNEIDFTLRSATINKDFFNDYYDAFLIPDEGNGRIMKLHDKLYSGKLATHHRLDIPYVPHISIANATDATVIKKLVDQLNEKEISISGRISSVDVINYENRVISTVEKIELKKIIKIRN